MRLQDSATLLSFTLHLICRASGHLLMDLLNVTERYKGFADMEFFVTSGDFQAIGQLSEDNTTFPTFSSSGSKRFYDLVLPEFTTTQIIM